MIKKWKEDKIHIELMKGIIEERDECHSWSDSISLEEWLVSKFNM